MNKNYYDILGIQRNASDDDIKKAYKKAAIKWHPDRWANKSESERKSAEEKFKEINEANDCLSDPDKRRHYDTFGSMEGFGQGGFGGGGFEFNMGDMFGDMFNMFGNRHQQRVTKGQTIQINVSININEILSGINRNISYDVLERCSECNGDGGTGVETCKYCHGHGMITETQRTPFGISQTTRPCHHCNGTGKTVKSVCKKCNGSGLEKVNKSVFVDHGPGIQHGQSMKFNRMGCQTKEKNGINGDLLVVFHHNYDTNKFKINNNIIYELIEVPYYNCILGTTFKHTLPNNKIVDVKIPEYSSDGTQVILHNEGINKNDYIIIVKVGMPKYLSKTEKDLIKQLVK
jgi:molecular chaperone DnaJ